MTGVEAGKSVAFLRLRELTIRYQGWVLLMSGQGEAVVMK